MFRFDRNKARIEITVGDHLGERFGDMRIGGNRISRDYIDAGHSDRFGNRMGAFHADPLGHSSSSVTIVMAADQHSRAQMPHPLQ